MSPKKKNLDAYLAEIFKEFIAIKDKDFTKGQVVFKTVFNEVKSKMEEQCNYFKKYSSQVMYAGSVYDNIKVSKLDEFDMDIVIRLPIDQRDESNKGLMMENHQPGFVKMKIIDGFDNLDKQPDWEKCHVVTKEWRDGDKYFLQNKFRHWLHAIVQKALNSMNKQVVVNDVRYILDYKECGPAFTLNIRNSKGDEKFNLDVDLVPVIRFQLPRWPEGYKKVNDTQVKDWLVVPKPNKDLEDNSQKNQCWRLSFQDFEREMMKNRQLLKTTIRLVKKLRDALNMKAIASYYIKTLFLWKIDATDNKYWQTKLSTLFATMVKELYEAIKIKKIPYYWHKDNNLIENLKPSLQKEFLEKLNGVISSIESNDVDSVVAALLTKSELMEFQKSEFYQNSISKESVEVIDGPTRTGVISKQVSPGNDGILAISKKQYEKLLERIDSLEDRVKVLEILQCNTSNNNGPDSQDSGTSSLADFNFN